MVKYIFAAVFLSLAVVQRIHSTFAGTPRKTNYLPDQLFAAFMVLLYGAVYATAIFDFLLRQNINVLIVAAGILLYVISAILRTMARKVLGTNWSIFMSVLPKRIISLGPYRYSRHPYYGATILELGSLSMIFHSFHAFMLIFGLYIPLVFVRIIIEEKLLRKRFKRKYLYYCARTPMLVSWTSLKRIQPLQLIKQLVSVIKSFGFVRLAEIKRLDQNISSYARHYFITQCLAAFVKVGLVDHLQNYGEVRLKQYCADNNYDFYVLKNVCDYLFIMDVLTKDNFTYRLTKKGTELAGLARGIFSLVYAYAPIFENLDRLIKKQIRYGQDIYRRGEFVGRGSAELARLLPFPVANMMVKKYGCKSILDLGCGSGDFLLEVCQKDGIVGYGIDLSAEAIEFARDRCKQLGLSETKIKFEVGDIFDLSKAAVPTDRVDMVTCMFVLHEFIEEVSAAPAIRILRGIRDRFPNSFILVCELCRTSLKHLRRHTRGVAEHHLFHALSNQHIVPLQRWHSIFKAARLKLYEEYRFDPGEQGYFVLKNPLI